MGIEDRGRLMTEGCNPRSEGIDRMSLEEAFDVIHGEDRTVAEAVGRARAGICKAAEAVAHALGSGGRLLYVGAGTSGRLGVLDAAECPPTFGTRPEQVQGILAGGAAAFERSVEGAEDSAEAGARALEERGVGGRDVVAGITAGGTTRFVLGALAHARRAGARTVLVTCAPREGRGRGTDPAEIVIRVLTGPEVLAGSTRMKAGTATKMVLNLLSTLAMIRLGKVYRNLMVDLDREACAKLRDRAVRIVESAVGVARPQAGALLDRAGDVKTAIVAGRRGVDPQEARRLLEQAGGHLRRALDEA